MKSNQRKELLNRIRAEADRDVPDLRQAEVGPYEDEDNDEGWEDDGVESPNGTTQPHRPALSTARRQALAKARDAQRDLEESLKSVMDMWKRDNPLLSKQLSVKAEVRVRPRSEGNSRTYDNIIDQILTRDGALSTQARISRHILAVSPSAAIPKDWGKPMPNWATSRLKEKIAIAPSPFNEIRVTGRTTLASLHRAARARVSQSILNGIQFSATITITDEHVFINEQSWRINSPKSGGRRVIISEQSLLKLAS